MRGPGSGAVELELCCHVLCSRRWQDALAVARRTRETKPDAAIFSDNLCTRVYGSGKITFRK
jgi:hypothetical protein